MNAHVERSRILKALTDVTGSTLDFQEAEQRLTATRPAVTISNASARTPAGQAAAITAIATAMKCFGNATLVVSKDPSLVRHLPLGATITEAAISLGAAIADTIPETVTDIVDVGASRETERRSFVSCWWDGWLAGVLPFWVERRFGGSENALAGVFAGGLAIRELFAKATGKPRAGMRDSIVSLWEPWVEAAKAEPGPSHVAIPSALWFIGLGHVGQGFLWSLGFLPIKGRAVLQDDQTVGHENVGTGLATRLQDVGARKTRVAARWLDSLGWETSIIERRHRGDVRLFNEDPAVVLSSIDERDGRLDIASTGFDYMIDAGVGHGPIDFEALQVRIVPQGLDYGRLWSKADRPKDIEGLMQNRAYQAHAARFDGCGTYSLAEASVAVPFVGAVTGAVTMAQLLRVAAGGETRQVLQMELACPDFTAAGAKNSHGTAGLGGEAFRVA